VEIILSILLSFLVFLTYLTAVYYAFPAGAIGIFHRHNPSGRTGPGVDSTEMNTRIISWG